MDDLELGRQIRRIRESRGISRYEVADILQCDYQRITRWELGKTRIGAMDMALLFGILAASMDEVFDLRPRGHQVTHDLHRATRELVRSIDALQRLASPKPAEIEHKWNCPAHPVNVPCICGARRAEKRAGR